MKKTILAIGVVALLASSCATSHQLSTGSLNQTEIQLSNANFNNLGTFSGNVTEKRTKASIKNMEGLVSRAKRDLLEKAKNAGVTYTGSKTLTNVSIDVIKNYRRITVTVSADIIEFTK